MDDQLIATRHLEADIERVWAVFTTPEHLAAFWGGEAGGVVVVTGTGVGRLRDAGPFHFAYSDLFTFRGDLVAQIDSYVVPLPSNG